MSEVSPDTASFREQALTATVHRACTTCGAPGVYHDLAWVQQDFPSCWVDAIDPRMGQPVGTHCPHCQSARAPGLVERLGEIWRKRFVLR